eukprot:10984817-Karenia_brevis.AAC.1
MLAGFAKGAQPSLVSSSAGGTSGGTAQATSPGPLLFKTVALTTGVEESVVGAIASALGGDVQSLAVDDILTLRVSDIDSTISSLEVGGRQATPLQRGAAAKLFRAVAH